MLREREREREREGYEREIVRLREELDAAHR